jgi:hypothetical protein
MKEACELGFALNLVWTGFALLSYCFRPLLFSYAKILLWWIDLFPLILAREEG